MSLYRRFAGLLGVVLLLGAFQAGPSLAQSEPTLESAHRFLQIVLSNGSSSFNLIDKYGYNTTWAKITSYSGAGCSSTVYGRGEDGQSKSRRINWTKIPSLSSGPGGLFMGDRYAAVLTLNGPVVVGDGSTTPNLLFSVDHSLLERLTKAAEFIRTKCDPTGGTGW